MNGPKRDSIDQLISNNEDLLRREGFRRLKRSPSMKRVHNIGSCQNFLTSKCLFQSPLKFFHHIMEPIRRNYKLSILSGFKFSYEMHKKLYKN